jgi:ABC-type polysaccharide/polyol phosphate transport system ATPase subunit
VYAVDVVDVHKKFRVYHDKGRTLKERLLFRSRNAYEERWALRGVSFSISKGEALGIVGENGSGKSTLLKLMSRIMEPERGSIAIAGRVSSLIELGAGFHPDMSGRENIYINAAIFGLTKKEIDSRLDAIIDFSELAAFIDSPVRTYSSGMYMRLAFSVAIHVSADVLLIDEILAVGDAAFQQKCFERLLEIKRRGTTIVIVSHSLNQIEHICERSIWLCDGVARMEGPPQEVHAQYLGYMARKSGGGAAAWRGELGGIERVDIEPKDGTAAIGPDGGAVVRVGLRRNSDEPMVLEVVVYNSQGVTITNKRADVPTHAREAVLTLLALPLTQGDYGVNVALLCADQTPIDRRDGAAMFTIAGTESDAGVVRVRSGWEFI